MPIAVLKKVVRPLYRRYQASDFKWRYLDNLEPRLRYLFAGDRLGSAHQAMLARLKRDGILVTSVQEFLDDTTLFTEMEVEVERLERALMDDLEAARARMGHGVKNYLVKLLGADPVLNPENIFVRFALQPQILAFANAYLGLYARLRYFNVWHNFRTDADPTQSQLWHRDPEDRYILKLFVYLTDVDEGAGPLNYAPGTHAYGQVKRVPESFKEDFAVSPRSTNAQMAAVLPQEKWVTATGKKSTLIFVDTRGYHKGGWCREKDRIVYTSMFTSRATKVNEYFSRGAVLPTSQDYATAFALKQ